MSDALSNAYSVLLENGFEASQDLRASMQKLQSPNYRVAFLGKFQTGKSTLINQAFLGSGPLHTEGNGPQKTQSDDNDADADFDRVFGKSAALATGSGALCTTSVVTEVAYGDSKTLEVYPWATETTSMEATIDGNIQKTEVEVRQAPQKQPSTVIQNPKPADLRAATTAEKGEARLEMSRSTALARLLWPSEILRTYTLIDTPGIDDPIPEIINNTTYTVIPSADIAVLVLEPKMMDQVELDFLKSRVFASGMSRMIVLLSYKPDRNKLGRAAREEILEAVKAQLSNIGRDNIPVEIFCYDTNVSDMPLNTPDAIQNHITNLLAENVGKARKEKTVYLLKDAIRTALLTIQSREALIGKSDNERREMQVQVSKVQKEAAARISRIKSDIEIALKNLEKNAAQKAKNGVQEAVGKQIQVLEKSDSITDVQKFINNFEMLTKSKLENVLFDVEDDLDRSVRRLAQEYTQQSTTALVPFQEEMQVSLQLNGGMLAKIPQPVVYVVDYVLCDLILPGGFIMGGVIRSLLAKMDGIRALLPVNLLKTYLVNNLRTDILKNLDSTNDVLDSLIHDRLETYKQALLESVDSKMEREIGAAARDLEQSAAKPVSEEERAKLAHIRSELENAYKSLENI